MASQITLPILETIFAHARNAGSSGFEAGTALQAPARSFAFATFERDLTKLRALTFGQAVSSQPAVAIHAINVFCLSFDEVMKAYSIPCFFCIVTLIFDLSMLPTMASARLRQCGFNGGVLL